MADQIVDKITVGIPSDELEIYGEVEAFAANAEKSANRAERAENAANTSATDAAKSAADAKAWALQHMGIWVSPTEPPEEGRMDGALWWQTNAAMDTVQHIFYWDGEVGSFLYPNEDLYPSDDLYPTEGGAWRELKLAATCIR